MELRRGNQARNHQLPHPQARARRPLLRAHLRAHQGLGVQLRQVQAHQVQGQEQDLRQVRRAGHPLQGAPRAHGPHPAGRAREPYLVLQGHPQPHGHAFGHQPPHAGKGALLCQLHRARSRRPQRDGPEKARADHRRQVPRDRGALRRGELPRGHGRRGGQGNADGAGSGRHQREAEKGNRRAGREGARPRHRGPEARPRGQAAGGGGGLPPEPQQARVDDSGRDPGHAAGPAPHGAAGRRTLRHQRPERPLPPRHQPKQPLEEAP